MTPKTRREYTRRLRKTCIDHQEDAIVRRVAYAMEVAIRRVTEDVRGWPTLEEEAFTTADLIRKEMRP